MPPDNEGAQASDLAGYSSADDLVKAYRSSSDEGKRQRQRADQAEARSRELEQLVAASQRQSVPQRGDPASRLADYGVPVDALDEYVNSRLAAAFEPIARGATARNAMLSSHPDYQKYEAEVAQFVNGDPNLSQSYQRMFSTDPVGAMEWAFFKFGDSKRAGTQGNGASSTQQAAARAEAQIPSSRSGDARTQPAAQADELLQRSWDHYQKTGDPRAFAKARLRQVISEDFLKGQ